MSRDLYLGPGPFDVEPAAPQEPGDYTVADQSRAFGVPEEQLSEEVVSPAGLPKAFWKSLGIGSGNNA